MRSIFDKGLQFLAKRDYSERELAQKLTLYFPEDEMGITEAIQNLKARAYLNNQRFLEGRVRHSLQQGYGRNKIVAELNQLHGFSKSEVLAYLETADNNQDEFLQILITKKCPNYLTLDFKERNKLIQFCLRRGFSMDQIKKALAQDLD